MLLVALVSGAAQAARDEFWPEFDVHWRPSALTRASVLLSATKFEDPAAGAGDWMLGLNYDITLKPVLRRGERFADWEQQRYFWMRLGYRHGEALDGDPNGYREDRGLIEFTARAQLPGELWASYRVKHEEREVNDAHSSRTLQRAKFDGNFSLAGTRHGTYTFVEFTNDPDQGGVHRRRYEAGVAWTLADDWVLETYLSSSETWDLVPSHTDALGITLNYYLR